MIITRRYVVYHLLGMKEPTQQIHKVDDDCDPHQPPIIEFPANCYALHFVECHLDVENNTYEPRHNVGPLWILGGREVEKGGQPFIETRFCQFIPKTENMKIVKIDELEAA